MNINIKQLAKELRFAIRKNKKDLKENISCLMSFFNSGNPAHIIDYQDVIQNFAKEIIALDDIIQLQEEKLKGLKSQFLYKKVVSEELYQRRKKSLFNRELMKVRSKNHLLFYDVNKESIMKKLNEKYDGLIVEDVKPKPVVIEYTRGHILEI